MIDYSDLFPSLPSDTDAWLYVADRRLAESEVQTLQQLMSDFRRGWSSHGREVLSDATVIDNQIVIIAATVRQGEISGCGIDKSLDVIDEFSRSNGFSWVNSLMIPFRKDDGALATATRSSFREMADSGTVHNGTRVIDISLRKLDNIRQGKFELPAGESWHARVFQLNQLQSS